MPRLISGSGLSLLILVSLLMFAFFSPALSGSIYGDVRGHTTRDASASAVAAAAAEGGGGGGKGNDQEGAKERGRTGIQGETVLDADSKWSLAQSIGVPGTSLPVYGSSALLKMMARLTCESSGLASVVKGLSPLVFNIYASLETRLSASSEHGVGRSGVDYEEYPEFKSDTPQHRLSSMRSHGNVIANSDTRRPYVAYNPSSSRDKIFAPESTARWLLSLVYPCQSQEHGAYGAAAAADSSSRQKNDSASSSSRPSFVQRIIPFPSTYRSGKKSSTADSAVKYRNARHHIVGAADKNTATNDQGEEIAAQSQENYKEVTPKPSATESKIPMEPQPQPQLHPAQAAQVSEVSSSSHAWQNNEIDLSPAESQLQDTSLHYAQQQDSQQQQQGGNYGQQVPMNSQQTQYGKNPIGSEAQEDGAGKPSSSISSAIFSIIHNDPPPGKGISLREKEIGGSCLGLVISVVFAIILF